MERQHLDLLKIHCIFSFENDQTSLSACSPRFFIFRFSDAQHAFFMLNYSIVSNNC